MGSNDNNMDDAVNNFKNTMKDLKNKKMFDDVADKYEHEKNEKKKKPFDK